MKKDHVPPGVYPKSYAMINGVKLYEVAKKMDVSPSKLSTMMRDGLTDEQYYKFVDIVDEIVKEKAIEYADRYGLKVTGG